MMSSSSTPLSGNMGAGGTSKDNIYIENTSRASPKPVEEPVQASEDKEADGEGDIYADAVLQCKCYISDA